MTALSTPEPGSRPDTSATSGASQVNALATAVGPTSLMHLSNNSNSGDDSHRTTPHGRYFQRQLEHDPIPMFSEKAILHRPVFFGPILPPRVLRAARAMFREDLDRYQEHNRMRQHNDENGYKKEHLLRRLLPICLLSLIYRVWRIHHPVFGIW